MSLLKSFAALQAAVASLAPDQYALRTKKAPKPSPGQEEFRWITIGAEAGSDGKKHGGHPVQIDGKGVMQTGKFAGQSLGQAFGDKSKKAEESTRATPAKRTPVHNEKTKKAVSELLSIQERTKQRPANRYDVDKSFAARQVLFDHGWSSQDIDDHIGGQENNKSPEQPAPQPSGIQPVTRPNESAKAGDQLGLFGQAAAPARTAAPTLAPGGETKGKQLSMFDTKGPADQQMLFATDDATPDDMIGGKPFQPVMLDQKKSAEPEVTHIPFRDRRAFADKMAADGKSHQEIVDAMQSRGVAVTDARRHAAAALGDKAQGEGSFADKLPEGWKESQPGGMATGPKGEIVDKEIKSGKWFAIGDGPTLEGFDSRKHGTAEKIKFSQREAFEAFRPVLLEV